MPRSSSSTSPECSKKSPCPSHLDGPMSVGSGRNMDIYKLLSSEIVHMTGTLIFSETLFGMPRGRGVEFEHSTDGRTEERPWHPRTDSTISTFGSCAS